RRLRRRDGGAGTVPRERRPRPPRIAPGLLLPRPALPGRSLRADRRPRPPGRLRCARRERGRPLPRLPLRLDRAELLPRGARAAARTPAPRHPERGADRALLALPPPAFGGVAL